LANCSSRSTERANNVAKKEKKERTTYLATDKALAQFSTILSQKRNGKLENLQDNIANGNIPRQSCSREASICFH